MAEIASGEQFIGILRMLSWVVILILRGGIVYKGVVRDILFHMKTFIFMLFCVPSPGGLMAYSSWHLYVGTY